MTALPGFVKGISRSSWPTSFSRSALRCSSSITSSSTSTAATPGTLETAAVTREVMVSRIGQPATVR
jgi:hypothetical protein